MALALAAPGVAVAAPVYVVGQSAGTIDRYDTGPGGALTKGPSVSTSLGTPAYDRLAVFSTHNGLLAGRSAGTGYAAFNFSGGTPVFAGNDAVSALNLAAHPLLPVVYYTDATSGNLTWRRRQSNGTAFSTALGQGGSRGEVGGAAVRNDVVVTDGSAGRSVFVGRNGTLYRYALLSDGSIDPGAPEIASVSAFGDVLAMAINPGGTRLYLAALSSATDYSVYDFPLLSDGDLVSAVPAVVSETTAPTDQIRKLAVSPDGADLYGTTVSGDIAHWSLGAGGAVTDPGDVQASTAPAGDGIGFNPGGGTLYTTSPTGGVNQYDRDDLTGALTPKTPFLVPGSSGTNPGDLVPGVLPVPYPQLAVTPARAGLPTSFDASASFDPDGVVNQFDWNFGDGTTAVNAGPTPTHVYRAAGTYTVTLTATDTTGSPTTTVFTGHSAVFSGGPSTTGGALVTIAAAPAAAAPPPKPVAKQSVVIKETKGSVLVKVPGGKFVPLSQLRSIPVGSQIDTRKGRVQLTSAADSRGKAQSALFYAGIFKVGYATVKKRLVTDATLVGKVGPCAKRKKARSSRKRAKRRLWGSGKGRFRTRGRRSSALVRGTIWLVEDSCAGTLTKVTRGSVTVDDFAKRKNIVVKKGRRYLARAR